MRCILLLGLAGLLTACDETPAPAALERADGATAVLEAPFSEAAAEAGLDFEHFIGASGQFFMSEIMGAGVALLDYDLDGDLDVYLLQGRMLGDGAKDNSLFPPPTAHWPGNRLFRNELVPAGQLAFTDVTEGSGLSLDMYAMGAATGDIDNDGDPDLYLTGFGKNFLMRNEGDGRFVDMTGDSGLDEPGWSTAAGFNDFDRDGDLDLFVVNYVEFDLAGNTVCTSPGGRRDYCGPQVYPPTADRLFTNDGNGNFRDVTDETGIADAAGPGLGLVWADFNGDGWTDAYVANDGAANFLWLNQNGETFVNQGVLSGTAYNTMGSPEASMGVTAGDVDGDGDEDLFMTHLFLESNTLYVNDGSGSFFDATDQFGLGHGSMAMTGFGSKWFDYDNDGDLDLFVANGNVKLEESRVGQSDYPFEQRNQIFRNESGERFVEIGTGTGVLGLLDVSRGAAFGDLDNDGDQDIVVTNNNGKTRLLVNTTETSAHWLSVRLSGTRSNRDGTGARVAVLRPGQQPLWRRAQTDGSYLSASDRRVHFGLGDDAGPVSLQVIWPTGASEVWHDITVDREITLVEGSGQ